MYMIGPDQTLKTQVSYEEVAQMPIVLTSATPSSRSQPIPLASWGVSYNQLTEEEKTWAQFTDVSARYASTI